MSRTTRRQVTSKQFRGEPSAPSTPSGPCTRRMSLRNQEGSTPRSCRKSIPRSVKKPSVTPSKIEAKKSALRTLKKPFDTPTVQFMSRSTKKRNATQMNEDKLSKPPNKRSKRSTRGVSKKVNNIRVNSSFPHDCICAVCADGGEMLVCKNCIHSFHEQCVSIPRGQDPNDFECPEYHGCSESKRSPVTSLYSINTSEEGVEINGTLYRVGDDIEVDACLFYDVDNSCICRIERIYRHNGAQTFKLIQYLPYEQSENELMLTEERISLVAGSPHVIDKVAVVYAAPGEDYPADYVCRFRWDGERTENILTKFDSCEGVQHTDPLPCREEEFVWIHKYIKSGIVSGGGESSGLFLVGMPGLGKTATTRRAILKLKRDIDMPVFNTMEVNALELPTPSHIYVRLYEVLRKRSSKDSKKVTPTLARAELSKIFALAHRKPDPLVLVIDEVDLLVSSKQLELYNVFNWASMPGSSLVILCIANTMDLVQRLLPKVTSRMGLNTLVFQPYKREQLQQILSIRLHSEKLGGDAIELCARRIAAVSGDVRRALQICNRALEMRSSDSTVTIADINAASHELFDSTYVRAITHFPLLWKLFLISIGAESCSRRESDVLLRSVVGRFITYCRTIATGPLPDDAAMQFIMASLQETSIITLEERIEKKYNIKRTVRLNMLVDDVAFALKEDEPLQKILVALQQD